MLHSDPSILGECQAAPGAELSPVLRRPHWTCWAHSLLPWLQATPYTAPLVSWRAWMTTEQPGPPAPGLRLGWRRQRVSSLQAPIKEQRWSGAGRGPQHLLPTTRSTLTHPPRGTLQMGEGAFPL